MLQLALITRSAPQSLMCAYLTVDFHRFAFTQGADFSQFPRVQSHIEL